MGRIEMLAADYKQHISTPWQRTMSGAQRVMMVVYEKELERHLRARIGEFEHSTTGANHGWAIADCTTWFSQWMAEEEYRESYFSEPGLLGLKLEEEFLSRCAQQLREALSASDENSVVGLVGVGSLYGFVRVSALLHEVEPHIKGRLLVFFPGTKTENNYRLLDARDGWNYLCQAITHHGQEAF